MAEAAESSGAGTRARSSAGAMRPDVMWPVGEAKARFSEVVELAREEGPQTIAKRGKPVAVIVSVDEWERKNERKGTLVEFLRSAPVDLTELDIDRARGHDRLVDFGI